MDCEGIKSFVVKAKDNFLFYLYIKLRGLEYMKISHLSEILTKNKKCGLELIKLSKKYKIVNYYEQTSRTTHTILPETKGISIYIKVGNSNNVNRESIEELAAAINEKFNTDYTSHFLEYSRLPVFSDTWFCQIKEKNVVVLGVNLFKPLENIHIDRHIEYIQWIFKNYISKALKGMKIRNKSVMEKEATANYLVAMINKEQDKIKTRLRTLQNDNNSYSKYIVNNIREMRQLKQDLFSDNEMVARDSKRIKREITETLSLPFVKSVTFDESNTKLIVDVGKIDIDDTYIGMFDIYIHSNEIRFKNRTKKIEKYDHPHIVSSEPCFGEGYDKIAELLAKAKLRSLVFMCYRFLKSYNENDANTSIDRWE